MKHITSKTHYFLAIAVSLLLMTGFAASQQPPKTAPPPAPPKKSGKIRIKDKTPKLPGVAGFPPGVEMGEGTTTERSIAVDQKVSIQLCINRGTVRINGWKRNEVRAFVSEGNKFGFNVSERSAKNDPVLISLVGVREITTPTSSTITTVECISGDEIELDVPENASLSLKGRETDTTIDTVRKVWVNSVGGDISVRNVSQGVRASTFQGDVTVEDSQGVMVLESSSGNVVAYGVSPSDVGDAFKAKTNSGEISLQKMGFRLAEVNSISGSVVFMGPLLSGGSFNFSTTNGSIKLAIPENSSCRITATYGYGDFDSTIPIKTQTEDVNSGHVKTVNAIMGSGAATLRLTTNSGSIQIRKLQP
jgi:hypothetical protein